MKINEYYRDVAHINLNGSIAALLPTFIIIGVNLSFFQNNQIMLLTLPFLLYSLIMFQMYLFKMNQALTIGENLLKTRKSLQSSMYDTNWLLVVRVNTSSPQVRFYYSDGHLAGRMMKWRGRKRNILSFSKWFALYDSNEQLLGYFKVKKNNRIRIEVYNQNDKYVGCLEVQKVYWNKKKKEFFDSRGKFYGRINGSSVFMDEKVTNIQEDQVGRLRRGWMPLEWASRFPEPNTPLLSFNQRLSEDDKLLQFSLIINEFFIDR